jgi:hypothetical protein
MSSPKSRSSAFEPVAYRKAIAEMFGALDASAQRELVERIAVLPRHIHAMASKGEIPIELPRLRAVAT